MLFRSVYRMETRRNAKSIVRVELILLTVILSESYAGQSPQFIIDRHNYVLAKKGELHVATASAKLLFHFELPPKIRPLYQVGPLEIAS